MAMWYIISSSSSNINVGFGETLTETSCEHAHEWTSHKAASDKIRWAVRTVLGDKYGRSLAQCSSQMYLQRVDGKLKARPFESCRKRWCPVCAWRLSMWRWCHCARVLPGIIETHGPLSFLMLTLTVRNCAIGNLRDTVKDMLKAWSRMTHHKSFSVVKGWLRGIEVTFPRSNEAHPHIHVLLAVKPSYFSRGYIKHAEWVEKWRKAMKLDYDPVVYVQRVKPLKKIEDRSLSEALGGLREVSKYVLKPADLAKSPEAAVNGLSSLRRVRMIEGGGILKGIFTDSDGEEELEVPREVENVAIFWWRAAESVYRRKL